MLRYRSIALVEPQVNLSSHSCRIRNVSWLARFFSIVQADSSNPYAADLLFGMPTSKIRHPTEEGLTRQDYALEKQAYWNALRERVSYSFRCDRARAVQLGSKSYVWQSSGADGGACKRCQSLQGKEFAWGSPPEGGHPGESACCEIGWCRCWANPVLPF